MKKIHKIILSILIAALLLCGLWILNHPAKTGYETTEYIPVIADSPSYVALAEKSVLSIELMMQSSIRADELNLLAVNTKSDGKGTITIVIHSEEGENTVSISEGSINVGDWISVPLGIELIKGQSYQFEITCEGTNPYFIMTPTKEIARTMPFTEIVSMDGEIKDTGISLGFSTNNPIVYKYKDIFYFSDIILTLLSIALLVLVWAKAMPYHKLYGWYRQFANGYMGDLLLVVIFIFSAVSIYYRAVSQGVAITSDSAGYLREAVSMYEGHGFSYDGVAGYQSWFANWPILYPALICLVMKLTSLDAYLASKILAMVLIGIILLILKLYYKKDAWFYALAIINLGFIEISIYTWSELLFMVFLLCFGLCLTKINRLSKVRWSDYMLLGLITYMTFLTRYFGIFLYGVLGLYILINAYRFFISKDKLYLNKGIGITVTAFVSGVLTLGYMVLNRIMNGMASGVSRGMWWDDLETLTNDLVDSLLTELFNAFTIEIPNSIATLSHEFKVIFILAVVIGLMFFLVRNIMKEANGTVFILMGIIYYCMFIVIRYRSSMDTFYFRFFEPATFLLTIGIVDILVQRYTNKRVVSYIGIVIALVLSLNILTMFKNIKVDAEDTYYATIKRTWDDAYSEIPEKSVVIFSDFDFRSSYYRADVIDGTISPSDNMEDIRNRYYGSKTMCLTKENAQIMMDEGDYDDSVRAVILDAMEADSEGRFITCALR